MSVFQTFCPFLQVVIGIYNVHYGIDKETQGLLGSMSLLTQMSPEVREEKT